MLSGLLAIGLSVCACCYWAFSVAHKPHRAAAAATEHDMRDALNRLVGRIRRSPGSPIPTPQLVHELSGLLEVSPLDSLDPLDSSAVEPEGAAAVDWRSRYEALRVKCEQRPNPQQPPQDLVAAEHAAEVAVAQGELRRAEQALAALAAKFQKTEAELEKAREQLATRQVEQPAAAVHECIPDHTRWNRPDWGYQWYLLHLHAVAVQQILQPCDRNMSVTKPS